MIQLKVPEHLRDHWAIYRIATHERNNASFQEIAYSWSIDEIEFMNDALDVIEEGQARASKAPPS